MNLNLSLTLSPDLSWDLQLEPFHLLAPDFRFKVLTEEGVEYQQAPTNAVFRGHAKGGGEVLMTVWEDYFVLSIRSQEEERFIEPLYKMVPGAAKNLYVSYRAADVLVDPALKCGHTEAEHHHEELPHEHKHSTGNAKMMCDAVFAELALAAAFDMVQKFGTVADVQQHIVDITTQMSGLYDAEDIKYQVVDIVIPASAAADPWSTDAFMDVLLPDFATWGNTAGNFNTHDIGQLWVARDVFRQADPTDPDDDPTNLIGRADGIGVVCTEDRYNVCEDFSNSMNCLRSLSAHEIGHLWGGVHGDATENVTIMSSIIVCDATVFTNANSTNFANHVASRTCLTSANDVPPVAVCQDITRFLDANGNATIIATDIDGGSTFSCGPSSFAVDVSTFDCDDTGANTVTLTVTDLNGLADDCTATVTIIDNTDPTIVCRDTTVALNEMGVNAFDGSILGTTDDNCSSEIDPLPLSFDCDDAGINFIYFLDASDPSGGDASCQINVSVIDTLDPVVVGADQTIVLDDQGMASVDSAAIVVSATDNCEVVEVTFSRSLDFTCEDIGDNEVTITAIDPSGNTGTTTVTVTVEFEQPQLACVGELNLTLNEACQGLLVPRMLLVGDVACLDVFNFEITVNDNDPSNGPIVDGCGRFSYSISSPDSPITTTEGFTGDFASFNWEKETITSNNNQTAEVEITETTLTLST
ncbi:MAG: hypothetical protein AAGA31_20330, partial [Bacteroidota bacterium]